MAGYNLHQGQIRGPFEANTELFDLIAAQCVSRPRYLSQIGIQTEADDVLLRPESLIHMTICGQEQTIEIGKNNIYEIGNTEITSIYFTIAKDNNTIIDYTAVI